MPIQRGLVQRCRRAPWSVSPRSVRETPWKTGKKNTTCSAKACFFLLQEYNEYYIHTVKDVIILNAVKTGIFHFTNKAYQEQCMESFQALHHDSTWLWVRVCWVSSPFSTTVTDVCKWPSLSCQPGKRWKMTAMFHSSLSLCSQQTPRCRSYASMGFNLKHSRSVSDYWLSQQPNLGLALGLRF